MVDEADWGKENLDVSGAVPLPENNCIIPYMWYLVNENIMCFASVATVFATRHNFGLNLSP